MVMQDLRAHFRPEFLNRLDETILFKPLTKDNISHIVDLMVADVNRRLEDRELKVELTDNPKPSSPTTVMTRLMAHVR